MVTTANQCKAETKAGQPCQGWAGASGYCFSHDPAKAAARHEARAKGGRARHGRHVGAVGADGQVTIKDLGDVVQVVTSEINTLLSLEKSISRARAMGYLAGVLVTVYAQSELERRIVALEARIG